MSEPRLSFGSVAASYDRGRPSYPQAAVEWLAGPAPVSVLELGAGTGKLTETLVALGHDVFATDPDDQMLDRLSAKLPDTRATTGSAEQIPAQDSSVDVVIAGQAFHWFDYSAALPEIARVLRPGGHLALVWNDRDDRIPWVRRLGALMGKVAADDRRPAEEIIALSGLFSAVEIARFTQWQAIDREIVQDLVLSRSATIALSEEEREAKRAEVLAFYDEFNRGMDGMQLPYVTTCYRSTVLPTWSRLSHPLRTSAVPPAKAETPAAPGPQPSSSPPQGAAAEPSPTAPSATEPPDDDTGVLLIDFT